LRLRTNQHSTLPCLPDHPFVDDDVSNFPLAVRPNATATTTAQQDGDDFFFVEEADCVKLDYEIDDEDTDFHTGEPLMWVRVPTVSSSTDTVVMMYYGNAGASEQGAATSTWDDNYLMVLHLEGVATASSTDSTFNNNDAHPSNLDTEDQIPGILDGSYQFDGVDESMIIEDDSLDGLTGFTLSTWIHGSSTQNRIFIEKHSNVYELQVQTDDDVRYTLRDTENEQSQIVFTNADVASEPTYITMTWDATTLLAFSNGIDSGSTDTAASTTMRDNNTDVLIACDGSGGDCGSEFYDGIIDEVRISDIARTLEWTRLEYYNQSNLFSVPSFGAEEDVPVVSEVSATSTSQSFWW